MPSRKQRRRREKNFRHEYETVLIDEEGNEVEVDPDELRTEREAKKPAQARATAGSTRGGASAKGKPARDARGRPLREVPPPTWERAIRRGGLMGVGMLAVSYFLLHNILIGIFYALIFIPFTFLVDRFAHRAYLRKLAAQGAPAKATKKS